MIIYTTIKNDENLNVANIRYWLINNCTKWILKNDKTIVSVMFTTIYDRRIDNIMNNLKFHMNKGEKNCMEILKSKINIFKAKKVNNNDHFLIFFKQHFLNNSIEPYDFSNIELKGHTKKNLLSMLKNYESKINNKNENNTQNKNIDKNTTSLEKKIENSKSKNENNESETDNSNKTIMEDIDKITKQTCIYCSKKFPSISNCNRHAKKCKFNKNDSIPTNENLNIIETIINNFTTKEEMKDVQNKFDNKLNNITDMIKNLNNSNGVNNNINNTTNTTNNVNIQINNNYKSKRDKLNENLCDGITLDMFLENYRNNPDFEITKDEAKILLENSENLGIISYSEGLFTCLKKKYSLQLEKIKGIKQKYYEVILPFICSDVNLRTHFEFNNNEWNLVNSNDKLKSIVSISDQQIFKHHNRFVCYSSKRGKNTVVNVFLRKSDFIEANKIIQEKNKQKVASITP